jgi:hypothetical protein
MHTKVLHSTSTMPNFEYKTVKRIIMNQNNVNIAVAYYTTMSEKNIEGITQYLHAEVQLNSPFTQLRGKDPVLEAVQRFITLFTSLTIQAHFGNESQAMIAYDVDFPATIGRVPTAALLTFQDNLISKIQLFFDTRPFEKTN